MDADSNRCCRRLPVGAEIQPGGGVHFRLWAPRCRKVEVNLLLAAAAGDSATARSVTLSSEADGYFAGFCPAGKVGSLYGFRLDEASKLLPDPASRFQPDGPHGMSMIVDPQAYAWRDQGWRGSPLKGQVLYELHIGTFTAAGTWRSCRGRAAASGRPGRHAAGSDAGGRFCRQLRLGIRRGESVCADAALRHARRFPALRRPGAPAWPGRAARRGLQPFRAGRQLSGRSFPPTYVTDRLQTDWGEAINFDGRNSGRSASSLLPTPAIGSTNFISTACGSTPCRRSSTIRQSTSWPRSGGACAGGRGDGPRW